MQTMPVTSPLVPWVLVGAIPASDTVFGAWKQPIKQAHFGKDLERFHNVQHQSNSTRQCSGNDPAVVDDDIRGSGQHRYSPRISNFTTASLFKHR